MVFSAPSFLFYFLPITIISYLTAGFFTRNNIEFKNIVLLFFSLLFYVYGSGQYIVLVIAITLSSYIFGLLITKTDKKQLLFIFSVSFPLLLLFVFKYTNFFVSQAAVIAPLLGLPSIPQTSIILPIGISFYTFQCLSYVIDVYLEKEEPERNLFDLLLYISMFPQLIAGPIVRYSTIAKQLHDRSVGFNDFSQGAARFMYGLSKKVIIADACGLVADTAYGIPLETVSTPVAAIGSCAYFLQIYFDFSAYSDMAIGLGRIFGFHFPENFNRPYSSSSVNRVLAPMAYYHVYLVQGLSLFSTRRVKERKSAHIHQPLDSFFMYRSSGMAQTGLFWSGVYIMVLCSRLSVYLIYAPMSDSLFSGGLPHFFLSSWVGSSSGLSQ